MIYAELFLVFAQIGLFSIGGGYAALPLIQAQVVDRGWLTMAEFADVLTISQMTPGPIAINAATFVGNRMGGIPGAVLATVGCVTPSFIIVLTLAYFYVKYREMKMVQGVLAALRPAVVALIASASISIVKMAFWGDNSITLNAGAVDFVAVGVFAAGLIWLRLRKPNPIMVMLAAGAVGGGLYLLL